MPSSELNPDVISPSVVLARGGGGVKDRMFRTTKERVL